MRAPVESGFLVRRSAWREGGSLTLCLFALMGAVAGAQPPAAPVTVSGVVTASDVPLARVRVAVAGTAGSEASVLTDVRGQFQIAVADVASVRLAFSKTGYLSLALDVPTRVSNERDTGLHVRLVRAGAISGRAIDQRGLPLRVTVTARRVGAPSTSPALSTRTNDLGEYRIGGLSEGAYTVSARPPSDSVGGPEARKAELAAVPVEGPPTNVRAGQESGNVNLIFNLPSLTMQRSLTGAAPRSDSPTASISGRVVGHDGAPIPGVSVFTMQNQNGGGWVTQTDASGRYHIDRLVAGAHTVRAIKDGYLAQAYGQVVLRSGQEARSIDITLIGGGAIAGTLVDEFGEPVEGVTVEVRRIITVEGRPRVSPQSMFSSSLPEQFQLLSGGSVAPALQGSETDDRGRYRIFGLQAGAYVVQAAVRAPAASPRADLPVLYPGTSVAGHATTVIVTPGADVPGVDLVFRPERGYRITGRVTHPDGRPARVSVVLATSDRSGAIDLGQVAGQTDADGSFTFGNVAPGEYGVQTGPMRGSQATVRMLAAGPSEFGAAFVTVRDGDPAPIEIGLRQATTLSGRVTYEGLQPSASQSLPMTIRPVDRDRSPRTTVSLPGFPGNRNGTFELGGLFGQAYFGVRSPRPEWYVKSIMVNGRDILDTPYDFGSGRTIAGAEIVVSSMTATASGRVTDERLAPVRDSTVVIFPASRDKWVSGSQWVKTARPVQDATFRIPGMPPGDYWIAAIDGMDEGATASEPGLLDSLSFRATRISLTEGQTQDVALRLIRR